jgi:hypothetical protein
VKNERVLHAAPSCVTHRGFKCWLENFGSEDEHRVVASIKSADDLTSLLESEIKPTVAVIGYFFKPEDAEVIAKKIREVFPGIIVVAFPEEKNPDWADYRLGINTQGDEFVEFLTELKR